jgi:hypothetical protein
VAVKADHHNSMLSPMDKAGIAAFKGLNPAGGDDLPEDELKGVDSASGNRLTGV